MHKRPHLEDFLRAVAQHFEVMDHRKGLFDDAVDDNNDANRSRFATRFRGGDLSLAAPTPSTSTLRSRFMFSLTEEGDDDERDPPRYEWDVNEDDFGTLGVHTPSSSTAELFGRKTDSLSRVEGYDDDSAPRSYNSSIALAYYHRLTGGGAADAVDKNARHFGTYVPSTDLDEEEAYLRYRLIEHCSFRAMQDVFHALCVYTGAKHATKSMKHHLRYMKRVGFVQFQGALMKVCDFIPSSSISVRTNLPPSQHVLSMDFLVFTSQNCANAGLVSTRSSHIPTFTARSTLMTKEMPISPRTPTPPECSPSTTTTLRSRRMLCYWPPHKRLVCSSRSKGPRLQGGGLCRCCRRLKAMVWIF